MSGTLLLLAVTVCGVVVGLMWLMATYNKLLAARQKNSDLFSRLSMQMGRRLARIGDLAETAQTVPPVDRAALDSLLAARAQSEAALAAVSTLPLRTSDALQHLLAAESILDAALARVLGGLERQPTWKTHSQRIRLLEEIEGAENEKSALQTAYNDSVTSYQTQLRETPLAWIAPLLGFSEEARLQPAPAAPPSEPQAPKGRFSASA